MALLLARLGRFAARRAWVVIAAWIVILAGGVAAFLGFGGTLATNVTIPGTQTQLVGDEIADELGGQSTGTANVVFSTDDGSALTDEQRDGIADFLGDIGEVGSVETTVDPFETQQQRADQASQLTASADELEAGRQQADAGQAQLDAGQAELDANRAQLDAALQQAAGTPLEAQLLAQQQELEAGQAQLDAQQAELDAGLADIDAGAEQLEAGQTLLEAADALQFVAADESAAIAVIQFDTSAYEVPAEDKSEIVEIIEGADIDGVTVDASAELTTNVSDLVGPAEIIGVAVAAIVLLVMLRGLLPAMLPIVSSLIGVGVGVTSALALSGVVEMTSITPVLGVMLGLAVGIDYTLFIVNRHRTQLRRGLDVRESIALANGTSGTAVVFAGSTVVIALLALNVTGIGFLGVMGSVGAWCVAVAVLIAISLTPAALSLMGTKVLTRKERAAAEAATTTAVEEPKPMRSGVAVLRVVIAVAALAVIAIPALSMRLGLPDGSAEPQDSTQYAAYQTTAEEFGEGLNGPLVVSARLDAPMAEDEVVTTQADVAEQLLDVDDVEAVAPVGVGEGDDFLVFQIMPTEGPASVSTEQLVHALRDLTPIDGVEEYGVAGTASGNIDLSETIGGALPAYVAIVIGLSFLILLLVFRSILVPLIATIGFALSLFAALGAVTAVYQWGWLGEVFGVHDPGPVLSFAPVVITGVLFGLAMDYQLFLVSGMREAFVHGSRAKVAVVAGLRGGAPVVTAAAIIMISVFGGFVFSHMAMVRPFGFGLAIGVLFDAFVVRMLLIPAAMHLLGRSAWWIPAWLDRILPNVDVEGSSLERDGGRTPHPTTAELAAAEVRSAPTRD
ncbi:MULTISPECIES: MMPL family transporter [unclassified Agrococcus]|uniref:MMPL family transporter n=1 Tax=unclassified Agrococcus TaxID=2615065 RepID=UPI0036241BB3